MPTGRIETQTDTMLRADSVSSCLTFLPGGGENLEASTCLSVQSIGYMISCQNVILGKEDAARMIVLHCSEQENSLPISLSALEMSLRSGRNLLGLRFCREGSSLKQMQRACFDLGSRKTRDDLRQLNGEQLTDLPLVSGVSSQKERKHEGSCAMDLQTGLSACVWTFVVILDLCVKSSEGITALPLFFG